MKKIQYFMPVLAQKLGVGDITEIHIDEVAGQKVLRITCNETAEYQTAQATERRPKKISARKESLQPKRGAAQNPAGIGDKLVDMGKKFMANKEKPQFMKDAGF